MIYRILLVFCLFFLHEAQAQFPETNYPQGYFRNPLGIPMYLAANFGELRNNHFHMGLDLRTNQRENLPVYAAAEGYVSRIKIEQYGFGRAIYITHPNGFTTLYAHLNDFYPALQQYIIDEQYRQEKWEQDLYLKPGMFAVTKGQFIANSGNTGGSAGPHLHFEIRETYTENNVNPLLFGLPVVDKIPPFFKGLYIYDRTISTYDKAPMKVAIRKQGAGYSTLSDIITSTPTISFGIDAEDKSNSSFNFGIYQAELYVDDKLQSAFQLDDFSYPDSRYINASVDYRTKAMGGPWIQHLSKLPGNRSPIFLTTSGNGVLTLGENKVYNIKVVLKDVAGNNTSFTSRVRYVSKPKGAQLTNGLQKLSPNQSQKLVFGSAEIQLNDRTLYDTVNFVYSAQAAIIANSASAIESLHNYSVPLHDSITIRIKADENLDPRLKDKVVALLISNKKKEALKGKWYNNSMEVKFRDLGKVQLVIDTVAPTLQPVGWVNGGNVASKSSITFLAKDNLGELTSFSALMDGRWLLFSRKKDYFIHHFDHRTSRGRHSLVVSITDQAGNLTEKRFSFTR